MQVSVSAQKISVPHQCACCGAFADKELLVSTTRTSGKKVIKTKTHGWSFPYCPSCLQQVSIANSLSNCATHKEASTYLGWRINTPSTLCKLLILS